MANTKEQQLQAFTRRAARVSKALWPTNVRHSIVTSKGAQTRRQLIVKSRYGKWSDLFPVRLGKRGRPQESPPLIPANRAGGRPQGSPPPILSSPAPTMNVRNVAGVTAGVAVGIVALLVVRLWLLILLFIIMLAVISLSLMIVRMRVSSVKHDIHKGDERKSLPGVLSKTRSPNTPVPLDPPLVRVLETFDLSQTNVEHFLDLPESGNTGGYSLRSWKEAQTSLPKIVGK